MSSIQHLTLVVGAVLLLGLTACGGDSGSSGGPDAGADGGDMGADFNLPDRDPDAPLEAAPRPAVLPAEAEVCLLDIDCAADRHCFLGVCASECDGDEACPGDETCSPRGRCLAASGFKSLDAENEGAPEYIEGVRIEQLPARRQPVDAGIEELTVTAMVSGPVPSDGVAYRVETTEPGSGTQVLTAMASDDELSFVIPTGRANPLDDEPTRVEAQVVSAVGSFRVDMIPRPPVGGIYGGEARVDRLGNMAIPIRFMMVTDPPDASLESADDAWILLPIGDEEILSPHEAFNDDEWMARPLEYDDFVDAWVARFDNEFRFSDDSLLGGRPVGQVGRTLRFEVEPGDGNVLVGTFTDRWTGLYDERNEFAVLEPGVVTYGADFEAQRFAAGLSPSQARGLVGALDGPTPDLLPLPPLDACDDDMLAVDPITLDEVEYDCEGIGTVQQFVGAEGDARAACAIAVAETALDGDTVAQLLAEFLDGNDTNPAGESFAEFMERCASGEEGACRPADEVLCGRQLVAYAYVAEEDEVADAAQLVDSFESATREAFLGRQLGAFQTDSNLRLEWLRTTDYPAIVTAAVEDLNAALLDEWVEGVLDVHTEVLSGQFDASGLAVLAREPSSEATIARRRSLLFDMTQGWRASMESLLLATQRWNALYQDDDDRAEATAFVSSRMVDLYVLAGLAGNLNQSAGAGFANSAFAGGFGALRRELRKLELPFNELVYARDAEIVVSTSLDPESDNNTVLREARELAMDEIDDAQTGVGDLLAEAEARALSEAQLRNQLDNDLDEARGALIELCGLPIGCRPSDYPDESECAPRIAYGECGFAIDRFTGAYEQLAGRSDVLTSDAGRAVLAVIEAGNNLNIVESEANAHYARSARAFREAESFAAMVEKWHDSRQANLDRIEDLIEARQQEWSATLQTLSNNILERQRLRSGAIARARQRHAEWRQIEVQGRNADMASRLLANGLEASARAAELAAEFALNGARIVAEGMPAVAGMSNDTTAPLRAAALLAGAGIAKPLRVTALGLETAAGVAEVMADYRAQENAARVRALQMESEFEQREYEAEIASLQDEAELIAIERGARDAEVDRLIGFMQQAVEVELAYERDQVELLDRRTAAWGLLQDNATMMLRTVEAQFQVEQRIFEYLEVVQRAELQQSRINELENQQRNVNFLLGSPAVVFSWANRLQQAELRLERAKTALMDWLVAMEYFAVRPFMDQRIQILLARNPYQLEAIAAEMSRLERACGGPLSELSSTVSLNALLGTGDVLTDTDEAEIYSPGEQLRAVLERGAVPVDTRTRYSPGENIGDLLDRSSVWAATVSLDLDRFANLALACNAKIVSFDVQLVGEQLGDDVRPTVTILYDGLSQLRSCQPGIADYVDQFGPGATAFNEITTFRTPSRSVSPVAGLNAFPSDSGGSGNRSLAGLPLASQYTILIDRQAGENGRVGWGSLDDVLLRVNYAYQDVFPVGQCE